MSAVQAISVAVGAGVLKFAADKITPVITSEISSIKGVKKDLSELQDIHKSISSCLDIGKGGDPSLSLEIKLKKVADDIGDLRNEVQHAEIKKINSDGYALVDYSPMKPKSFMSRIKIAHRIKAIKKTHAAILKQKSDTNTILNNLTTNPPVAVQGMRAREKSLSSELEEQKIQEMVQGEDSKCTFPDSDEGMDEKGDTNTILNNLPIKQTVAVQGMRAGEPSLSSEVEEQKIQKTVQGEDSKCTLSDLDKGMDGKSDTSTILNNLSINPPAAVQGMRAGEQSLSSEVEEQKIQEMVRGEDNKCTLSDSDEGMDEKSDTNTIQNNLPMNPPVAVQGTRAGEQSLSSEVEEQKIQETVQEEDNKCTLSDSDKRMDDGWIIVTVKSRSLA